MSKYGRQFYKKSFIGLYCYLKTASQEMLQPEDPVCITEVIYPL